MLMPGCKIGRSVQDSIGTLQKFNSMLTPVQQLQLYSSISVHSLKTLRKLVKTLQTEFAIDVENSYHRNLLVERLMKCGAEYRVVFSYLTEEAQKLWSTNDYALIPVYKRLCELKIDRLRDICEDFLYRGYLRTLGVSDLTSKYRSFFIKKIISVAQRGESGLNEVKNKITWEY